MLTTLGASLKSSPLPDILSMSTEITLESYKKLDSLLGLSSFFLSATQELTRHGIKIAGVVTEGIVRVGVAYHRAPSYTSLSSLTGSNEGLCIRRVNANDAFPGFYPFLPDMHEKSSQTLQSCLTDTPRVTRKKSFGDALHSAVALAHERVVGEMSEEQIGSSWLPSPSAQIQIQHPAEEEGVMTLNVSGHLVQTTYNTLTRIPSHLSSFFTRPSHDNPLNDFILVSPRETFFDFDSDAFVSVLSYCRTGQFSGGEGVEALAALLGLKELERGMQNRRRRKEYARHFGFLFSLLEILVLLASEVLKYGVSLRKAERVVRVWVYSDAFQLLLVLCVGYGVLKLMSILI